MRRIAYLAGWFGCLLVGLWFVITAVPPTHAPTPVEANEAERLPSEWGWVQRTYPHFQADADAYRAAFAEAQALKAASKTDTFGTWKLAGPTNIGGRIVDVAFDPQTPSTIYAAAATGGVFKSTDSGTTWQPIFDDQPLLTIGDIAVDPTNPQILYVGTGEANGGHNNFAGAGLYKSTDGGATWSFAGLENTTSIGRILVHPTNPQRVYVAAVGSYFAPNPERGVYRSDDGGATWQQVLFVNNTTGAIDLVIRPDAPDVLFAAMWQRVRRVSGAQLSGPSSGIFTSTDGGDSWTRLGPETGLPDGRAGRIGLALCRDVPNTMYALYNDGSNYSGLYRTDDGGQSWRTVDPDRTIGRGTAGFSWYFGQVRVHPQDPDRVFAMDVQFMQSTNGGDTFSARTTPHVDHHALAFHPTDPDFAIMGNDGGLAISRDRGLRWSNVDDLPITQFYEIGIDPSNPTHLYGGTQDNGTLRTFSDDPDEPWSRIFGGDGFYVIIDPTDPNIIYAESQRGALGRSSNGGFGFSTATFGIPPGEPRNWSTPVVMDPSDPNVLYYGTNRVYRTTNGTQTWERISDVLTEEPAPALLGTITTIAVAPTNSDVIFAGTDDGHVWVTSDYGATWQDVSATLPRRWVTRVAVDPTDDTIAYATFSGLRWREPQPHVFRTTDRGATWQDISANLPDAPVNAFAIAPVNTDLLFVGSDIGAFVSTDAGGRWEPLGEGLPAVSVYDMKVHLDDSLHFLVAGTHGRSMYTLDLTTAPVDVEEETPVPETFVLDPAFPNPFSTSTTLRYALPEAASAHLEIYDLLGRRIANLVDTPTSAGPHTTTWNATDDAGQHVAAGTYVARLSADGKAVRSVLLTVVK